MPKQRFERNVAPPPPQSGFLGKATLAAACLLLLVNVTIWTQTRSNQAVLTGRLTRIEAQMDQITSKIDNVAKGAVQKGLDPNKVYTVKTESAPSEGPAGAPVTIAEFSDFQ